MSTSKSQKTQRKMRIVNDDLESLMNNQKPGTSDDGFDLSKFRDAAFEELSLSLTENANQE